MNLIHKYIISPKNNLDNDNLIEISNFRKEQYNNLNFYLLNIFNYLFKISDGFIKLTQINIEKEIKYCGLNGYKQRKVKIFIQDQNNPNEEKLFLSFNIPELVNDNFFYISGCYYCPALYILDYPIIYKSESIKLYGLINSLTIYLKPGSSRAIFGGKNIPIQYFLQWFIDDDTLLEDIENKFKIDSTIYNQKILLSYFSNLFNCTEDKEEIDTILNDLFFDEYTYNLYKKCYNIEFNIRSLINYSLRNFVNDITINFVDLKHKRLIFMEQLLSPLFKKISDLSFTIIKGIKQDAISLSENEIIKFFMTNLKHQFYYDLVNLYSGIAIHKASFMNCNSKTAPKEISSVHESHFGKICPATISAQKPGENISIVSGTKIDEYGLFY